MLLCLERDFRCLAIVCGIGDALCNFEGEIQSKLTQYGLVRFTFFLFLFFFFSLCSICVRFDTEKNVVHAWTLALQPLITHILRSSLKFRWYRNEKNQTMFEKLLCIRIPIQLTLQGRKKTNFIFVNIYSTLHVLLFFSFFVSRLNFVNFRFLLYCFDK